MAFLAPMWLFNYHIVPNFFPRHNGEVGGWSWSSELELESGGEFLATKNRRSRRCQELELENGVVERSWRRGRGAFLASDAVARMCGPNCEIYMGDGIRSERLGNIPQSGTWARAVPQNAPRTSRRYYFLPPLNAEEPERARR